MMRRLMERLLEIRDRLLRGLVRLPSEAAALEGSAGRILAATAVARRAAPPFACSAMDGYALRAGEGASATLPVAQIVYAGDAPRPLAPGEAARIFTGGQVPEGADAVIQSELADEQGGRVTFKRIPRVGENIRRVGEDVEAGGEALPAGALLGPRQLALLAAVGAEALELVRRPRVTVLSTGDEVLAGRTPDSNGVAVAGLCRAAGAEVERATVPDRLDAVAAALEAAAGRSDLVVTIGGVSVGDRDLVPGALARLGAEVRVHGVPMKPGKPFLFARLGAAWVAGLPGSPSACLAAFEVFARPALLTLAGAAWPFRPMLRLRLAEAVPGRAGRARLVWAALEPDGRARLLGRDTAQIRGPALADLLLLVPAAAGDLAEGAEVGAWLLDGR